MSENTVFGPGYADCYDHFYADKDYTTECDFLEEVFRRYASGPVHSILDLGCGTGGHARLMAQRGYQVTGVDHSQAMLAIARAKANADSASDPVAFHQGDIRNLELDQTADVAIAMFAVMGYMFTNEDLASAFRSVRKHLTPKGLFVFDAWFGPGVLVDRPTDRYKIIEARGERIVRFAHTALDPIRHMANVHYHVLKIRDGRITEETDEVHPMRFLFPQEVAYYLDTSGFELKLLCPFPGIDVALSDRHWTFAVVAQAKG